MTNTSSARHDVAGLHLTGILVDSLPTTLGTDLEPGSYDVAAVFSRRPDPAEVALIHGPYSVTRLADDGHREVGLTVSDRRLVISNTNIAMLKDGLSTLIADILVEVSGMVAAEKAAHAEAARRRNKLEVERAALIRLTAEGVQFVPTARDAGPETSTMARAI